MLLFLLLSIAIMVKVKNTKIPHKRLTKQEQLGQNMSRLKSDFVDIERMLHFTHLDTVTTQQRI